MFKHFFRVLHPSCIFPWYLWSVQWHHRRHLFLFLFPLLCDSGPGCGRLQYRHDKVERELTWWNYKTKTVFQTNPWSHDKLYHDARNRSVSAGGRRVCGCLGPGPTIQAMLWYQQLHWLGIWCSSLLLQEQRCLHQRLLWHRQRWCHRWHFYYLW